MDNDIATYDCQHENIDVDNFIYGDGDAHSV